MLEIPGLALVIESPNTDAKTLDEKVATFMKDFADRLAKMPSDAFEQQRQAVLSRLREQPKQLGDVSERYWREIDRRNFDFNTREELIKAVSNLKQTDLVARYRNDILPAHRSLLVTTSKAADTDGNDEVRSLIRQRPLLR